MRWLVAPLVAVLFLGVSGFMDALESHTESSLELARTSEDAPRTTRDAARDVGALPDIARLTSQQADALEALADALEGSAQRVANLNDGLDEQLGAMADIEEALTGIGPTIGCVRSRLGRLTEVSEPVPGSLNEIIAVLEQVTRQQDRSVRHLRSINTKLTALGVVATVTGVEPPPPPPSGGGSLPETQPRAGAPCP
jgi:hypothetical protein